ncbi:MAG: TRAP transporter permease [Defluviitaleaceae bacterium]|nr:TRAP transporter permease [Defluviitaleaceae bacterium]
MRDIDEKRTEAISDEESQQILAQYDQASNTRIYRGLPKTAVRWLCVGFTLFVLAINTFIMWPPQVHRSSFVGLVIFLTFLLYPANKKNNVKINYVPWYDIIFAFVGMACFLYYAFNFRTIVGQMATFTTVDLIVAITGIIILFVACHRVVGLPLMIVVATFIGYAFFGRFIPGQFGHAGFRFERVFTYLFYTTEGVIGIPTAVASTFIFVFILFAAFLEKTGIGQFFIDISTALTGKAAGGPAKAAVVVSALGGTITGSSIANTVASGSFTIPMMKRLGYDKNFAGAVEASASTGGQILPPIMGAAAFLMVEITGIPYSRILLAAIIPALLYFICVFAGVHFESKKKGLRGLPAEEIPKAIPLFLQKGHLLLGIVAVVFFLATGSTPTMSAFFGILVSVAVSMIRKDTRLNFTKIFDALELGARNIVSVAVACAMAGIIVGIVALTGLGITFSNAMVSLADGIGHETVRLLVVLFFCMLASLILGMGVPTTAKYVILATVTAPILVQLGIPLLAAHFFVLYFGTDADITPPVGLASYAGAAIARGDPMITSLHATRLAAAAYIVPFIFALSPQMLFIDTNAFEIIQITITGVVGIVALASGLFGYLLRNMRWYLRVLAISAGLVMINPGWIAGAIGMAVVAGIVIWQLFQNKRDALVSAA